MKKKTKKRKKKIKTYYPDADRIIAEVEAEEKADINYFSSSPEIKKQEDIIKQEQLNINQIQNEKRVISFTPDGLSDKEDRGIANFPLSSDRVELKEYDILMWKRCPLCDGKIKRSKVINDGLYLTQTFKCKNKKCPFEKEIKIIL